MSKKPYFTMEEIISIPRLSRPAVSEDGNQLAWVESVPNCKHVQIYDVATGRTTAITSGEGQSDSPAWSSHGRLAWLSSVGEGEDKANQVFVLDQGQPVQVTRNPAGVTSFRWGPNGKGLYFLAPDGERRQQLKKRKEKYGDLEFFHRDYVWNSLYYQDLLAGIQQGRAALTSPKDLRQEDSSPTHLAGAHYRHILNFDISPDNNRIIFLAAPTANPEDGEKAALFLLNIATGRDQHIPTPAPPDDYGRVLFAPDGNKVCYTRAINEGKWGDITTLEVLDLDTYQTSQPLLDLDDCIYPLRWTQRGLVFTWQQKTDWYVGILTPQGRLPLQDASGSVTMEAATSNDGTHLATLTATQKLPVELYLNGAAVTNQSSHYQGKSLSNKEVVSWQSLDGTTIEGVLITPPGSVSQPSPLLIVVHGGPTWAAFATPTDDRYYPYEQFVQRGFIILDVNYRGSSGYGSAFRKLNFRNLGVGDYQDVISGVDMLVQQGLADKDRVGVMGWSQGGYISAMCSTYSDRFKAISAGAGISSWYTYYANTDIPHFTRHYLDNTPWNDPDIYAKTSPITYLRQACTPTLILHGDRDLRVPYANARELYRGLVDMGVPVELVTFKGMGHNPTKPGLHRAIMHQNYTWFCHHLMGDSLDDLWLMLSIQDRPEE